MLLGWLVERERWRCRSASGVEVLRSERPVVLVPWALQARARRQKRVDWSACAGAGALSGGPRIMAG